MTSKAGFYKDSRSGSSCERGMDFMTKARSAPVNSGCLSAAAKKSKPGTAMRAFLAVLAATALLASAAESPAVDIPLPPVNLGDTSFQDAIAFPGWLVEETFSYYHANQFNDYQGHDRSGLQPAHHHERRDPCGLEFPISGCSAVSTAPRF